MQVYAYFGRIAEEPFFGIEAVLFETAIDVVSDKTNT